jgi:predicted MFS family arabinose efflux permease
VGTLGRVLTPYRRVLSVPGAWQFSAAGFFGRLPIAMVSLGIVLLVSAEAGSYGLAGTVVSAYLIANAALAIVHGRLVDRFGQHRVLPAVETLFVVALALLMWSVEDDWHPLVVHALAAVAGGSLPQIGACVRARWSHVLDDTASVQTAYAFESVVDEALFVTGPTVVTLLATAWDPVAGLVVAMACGLGGVLWLSAQRSTEPPDHRQRASAGADTVKAPMPWRVVAPLVVVCVSLGAVFGSTEVITVAFAEEQGAKALAGPLLGIWALGSLLAGLVTGAIAWRSGPEVRVRWGILALGLTLVPLGFVGSLWVMAGLLLLGGMAIAPTLIATLAVTERSVPRSRLTEGMAILHTGMGVGIAPGAALGGLMIDAYGASPAYAVPAVAGLLGAAAAWLARAPVPSRPVPSTP